MNSKQVSSPGRLRRSIVVRGIVQGVGFRPFVYSLACRHDLAGWVRNQPDGVRIEVEGSPEGLEEFLRGLREGPPLAALESVSWHAVPALGEGAFRIEASRHSAESRTLVSPDLATCEACLRELFDPTNRRYQYPFINCTGCGPRFTILRALPYDRPLTTMADFTMCEACAREYHDPANRRFHAQPNACAACGPHVRLVGRSGQELPGGGADPVARAGMLLREGAVLAIKGLGGYHLACDPFNPEAIATLRNRKRRPDRPLALMVRDLAQARELCRVGPEEAALLQHPARPIVLLERRDDTVSGREIAPEVAPRQPVLGLLLPYTPLHHRLLGAAGTPLVMTSGNRSGEPMLYQEAEAFAQLGEIADAFLVHDRPIHVPCDDSVLCPEAPPPEGPRAPELDSVLSPSLSATFIRRARGFAPAPIRLAESVGRPLLACGGELKATFCLARERHAFLSHHLGDLANDATFRAYLAAIAHYRRLFEVEPEAVACDLHPEYFSTQHARELAEAGLPLVPIQHHHAHAAACLADNQCPGDERVIAVVFDGTGLGTDGALWGGEFFTGSVREGFARRAHLEYVPLPGGEAAIRQPWRMAAAHLEAAFGKEEMGRLPLERLGEPLRTHQEKLPVLSRMMERGINSPPTSSAGRLFDAVSALLGLPGTHEVTYEGQAAVELEAAAGFAVTGAAYPVELRAGNDPLVLGVRGLITGVVDDLLAGRPAAEIAARFHASLARGVVDCCRRLRETEGLEAVALSGGTFQNRRLLRLVTEELMESGFTLYRHRQVPPNDGGLALGQAVLADWILRREEKKA